MSIEGREERPRYLIRLLGRMYDELILRNVFAVSTSVSVSDYNGSFSVVMDNRLGPDDQFGFYHIIQPMDYIEIFMYRQPMLVPPLVTDSNSKGKFASVKGVDGRVTDVQVIPDEWGFYDSEGIYRRATTPKVDIDGSIKPFIKDPSTNLIIANGGFPDARTTAVGSNISVARPLTVCEKASTPTFVFCGFVDAVTSNFSMGEGGQPSVSLTINGRSMGKVLSEHNIIQNTTVFRPDIQFIENLQLTAYSPATAIKKVLDLYLIRALSLLSPSDTTTPQAAPEKKRNTVQQGMRNKVYQVLLKESAPQGKPPGPVKDKYGNTTSVIEGNTETISYFVYYRTFISQLSYATESVDIPQYDKDFNKEQRRSDLYNRPLGRLQRYSNTKITALNNVAAGPIGNTVKNVADTYLNENWVDECGRVVLRSVVSAWNSRLYSNDEIVDKSQGFSARVSVPKRGNDGEPILAPRTDDGRAGGEGSFTTVVENEDVISWQLQKSDGDMKTLVIIQPVLNVIAALNTAQGLAGTAPWTTAARQMSMDSFVTAIASNYIPLDSPDALSKREDISKAYQADRSKLPEALVSLIKQQNSDPEQANLIIKTLNQQIALDTNETTAFTYWSSSDDGAIKFWQDFLLRPYSVIDIFSDSLEKSMQRAKYYFDQFSQLFSVGSITVKGHPKYKAGTRIYVRPLKADFYVNTVAHDFPWGSGPYTTTLTLVRGYFVGKLGSLVRPGAMSFLDAQRQAAAISQTFENSQLTQNA